MENWRIFPIRIMMMMIIVHMMMISFIWKMRIKMIMILIMIKYCFFEGKMGNVEVNLDIGFS